MNRIGTLGVGGRTSYNTKIRHRLVDTQQVTSGSHTNRVNSKGIGRVVTKGVFGVQLHSVVLAHGRVEWIIPQLPLAAEDVERLGEHVVVQDARVY